MPDGFNATGGAVVPFRPSQGFYCGVWPEPVFFRKVEGAGLLRPILHVMSRLQVRPLGEFGRVRIQSLGGRFQNGRCDGVASPLA